MADRQGLVAAPHQCLHPSRGQAGAQAGRWDAGVSALRAEVQCLGAHWHAHCRAHWIAKIHARSGTSQNCCLALVPPQLPWWAASLAGRATYPMPGPRSSRCTDAWASRRAMAACCTPSRWGCWDLLNLGIAQDNAGFFFAHFARAHFDRACVCCLLCVFVSSVRHDAPGVMTWRPCSCPCITFIPAVDCAAAPAHTYAGDC